MSVLSSKNPHPRDDRIRFVEQGHLYYIDGKSDGIVSATTFIKRFTQPFDADKAIDMVFNSKTFGPGHRYWGMSRQEIKDQWKNSGEVASSLGTKMHANIELHYNGVPVSFDTPEMKHFERFLEDHRHLEPYRTEWCVFSEDHMVAGSIDMVFKNPDGTLSIFDWKRTKALKKTAFDAMKYPIEHLQASNFNIYSLQLNLYRWILENYYGVRIKDLFLVVLHDNQDSYTKVACADLQEEVDTLMELRIAQLEMCA